MPDGIAHLLRELIASVSALVAVIPTHPVVTDVNCVKGCQDSNTLGIVGLVVAGIGLVLAGAAAWAAFMTLKIARREHVEFMKRVTARARGDLTMKLLLPEGNGRLIETTTDKVWIVWELGLKNGGDKLAAKVGYNFLYPQDTRIEGRWSKKDSSTSDRQSDTLDADDETLTTGDGGYVASRYLQREREAVGTRTSYVDFVTIEVDTGALGPGAEVWVPVKFKVWSDDFPDEAPEVFVLDEVLVRKLAPPTERQTPAQSLMNPKTRRTSFIPSAAESPPRSADQ